MSTATTVDFPVGEIFGKAWGRMLDNIGAFVPAMLIITAASIASYAVNWAIILVLGVVMDESRAGLLGNLVGFVLLAATTGPLNVGLFGMAKRVALGQSVAWNDVFSGFDYFKTAALAQGVYSVLVAIGSMFCGLPGLIVSFLYCLTWLRVVEGETNFWQAMESGRRIVMDNLVSWLILFLLLIVINGLGMIPCGLGLLLTLPFSALVLTDAHARQLNRA